MIPGFVEGVVGMAVGDSKTVDCTFPEDYPKEDARGREASFAIELKDLKTPNCPSWMTPSPSRPANRATADLRSDLEQRLKMTPSVASTTTVTTPSRLWWSSSKWNCLKA